MTWPALTSRVYSGKAGVAAAVMALAVIVVPVAPPDVIALGAAAELRCVVAGEVAAPAGCDGRAKMGGLLVAVLLLGADAVTVAGAEVAPDPPCELPIEPAELAGPLTTRGGVMVIRFATGIEPRPVGAVDPIPVVATSVLDWAAPTMIGAGAIAAAAVGRATTGAGA